MDSEVTLEDGTLIIEDHCSKAVHTTQTIYVLLVSTAIKLKEHDQHLNIVMKQRIMDITTNQIWETF
jgi:hypothetical protein